MANPSFQQSSTRVLVTGGGGFVGSHIVEQLLLDRRTFVAIVNRNPCAPFQDDRLSTYAADIASDAEVQRIFDAFQPHVIIHTASSRFGDTLANSRHTNVEGTNALLRSARHCDSTRIFIYTSSDSAVEPGQPPLTEENAKLYDERHYPHPYGLTKALADAAVQSANSDELHTVVLRFPLIYGERDVSGSTAQFASSVRKKQHKIQIGKNNNPFEFIYVGKAAEAHILAMRALMSPSTAAGVAGEAFFITDNRPQPFFDFARRCYACVGGAIDRDEVTVIPMYAMQVMASVVEWVYFVFTLGTVKPSLRRDGIDHLKKSCCWSIDKAKQQLGYEPIDDQDAAIKRSMEWAMANP